jgi:hypothetical protein
MATNVTLAVSIFAAHPCQPQTAEPSRLLFNDQLGVKHTTSIVAPIDSYMTLNANLGTKKSQGPLGMYPTIFRSTAVKICTR